MNDQAGSAINSGDITFRPLAEMDLPQMHVWLNNPKVAQWYGLGIENTTYPTIEQLEENYLPRIRGDAPTFCYIMCVREVDFGFLQTYRIGSYPTYASIIDVDPEAWGIDIFIGEDEYRDSGLGTAALRLFVEEMLLDRPGVELAVIAPNAENSRAIRSYEKAGFEHLRTVWVEMEKADEYVMVRRKD